MDTLTDLNTLDAEFDAMPSATQERVALRAAAERAGCLGIVIVGSRSEGKMLKAVA